MGPVDTDRTVGYMGAFNLKQEKRYLRQAEVYIPFQIVSITAFCILRLLQNLKYFQKYKKQHLHF